MSKFSRVRLAMAGLCLGAAVTMGSVPAWAEDITYLLPAPLSLPAFGPFVGAIETDEPRSPARKALVPSAILILVFLSVAGLCHLFGGTMGGVRAGQRSRRDWWRLGEGESEQQVVP